MKRQPYDAQARREATIARRQTPVEPSTVKLLVTGRYGHLPSPQAPKPLPKLTRKQKVRQDLRDSARGEPCQVRYIGVCCHDPEKTILSHARWGDAGKGRSTKAVDLASAYACVPCDMAYDGQTPMPQGYTRDRLDLEWALGHFRTLVRMAEKGLL